MMRKMKTGPCSNTLAAPTEFGARSGSTRRIVDCRMPTGAAADRPRTVNTTGTPGS
jgi:hypothetical protein